MKKIIEFLVGLWILWLPIAGGLYLICNDALDAVAELNAAQLIRLYEYQSASPDELMWAMKSSNTDNEVKEKIFDITTEKLENQGINVNNSIFDIIKEREDVHNIDFSENEILEYWNENYNKTFPKYLSRYISIEDIDNVKIITSEFNIGEYGIVIRSLSVDSTFMNPWDAEFIFIDRIEISKHGFVELENLKMTPRKGSVILKDDNILYVILGLIKQPSLSMDNILPKKILREIEEKSFDQ
ncbi:hypothetical protein ABIE64_004222 [Thalassospira sp. MBR-102]|uniref:hypothetical protein n=1 Tax=Thalassospira sp. MBR-102 TaxID=3156466 RepID=UPI00339309FE